MQTEALTDTFGRVVGDLRISVTDRCNFRCTYCMPAEGLPWTPRDEVLTYEEIERIAGVFVGRFGVRSIRLTGGEPLVRADIAELVARLHRLGAEVAMTTNGAGLALVASDLADAGLGRINISLDSLDPDRFAAITRRDRLGSVLDGIDAAVDAGLDPVKVNVVVVRGRNDDEIVELAAFGRDHGVVVRFIELMPLEADETWSASQVVPSAEIVETIVARWPLEPVGRAHEPAETWRYVDGAGSIGVIGTVTAPFCTTCDRVRLSADGRLRNCLFALDHTDLRAVVRGGGSDDDLAEAIRGNVAAKWAGHHVGTETFVRPPVSMSQIGG